MHETTSSPMALSAFSGEWPNVSIGELGFFYGGLTGKQKQDFGRGSCKYVIFLDIMNNAIIDGTFLEAVNVTAKEKQNRVCAGDILFTGSSETTREVAMCALVGVEEDRLYLNSFCFGFRITSSEILDALFFTYLMRSPVGRQAIASLAQGSTRYNVSKLALSRTSLPLPDIKEQLAIVRVLFDLDTLLDKLNCLIAKKRDIKRAAMQQLLTGRTRLPGFKGDWQQKSLGEVTESIAGGTPSTKISEYWNGSIRWMNSGDLNQKLIDEVEGRITSSGLQNSSTRLLPAHCVLIGLAGQGKTRGTVAMNTVSLCTNQSIAALLPRCNFEPKFVYHNLNSRYDELRTLSSGGGGRGALNLDIIRSLQISIPNIAEQRAISSVLSDMDDEIASLQARMDKTQNLKQAMMQELLTGRTRLLNVNPSNA